jgi:hypothetical protein
VNWPHLAVIHARNAARSARSGKVFVYIHGMAQIPQISTVSSKHGKTARAIELAMITAKSAIKVTTPKTITIKR